MAARAIAAFDVIVELTLRFRGNLVAIDDCIQVGPLKTGGEFRGLFVVGAAREVGRQNGKKSLIRKKVNTGNPWLNGKPRPPPALNLPPLSTRSLPPSPNNALPLSRPIRTTTLTLPFPLSITG